MLSRHGIFRPSQRDISDMDRTLEICNEATAVLRRCPEPDTFLGRKTQESLPKEA